MMDAFRRADDVLLQAVQGITDLITDAGYHQSRFRRRDNRHARPGCCADGHRHGEGPDAASKAMRAALDYKLLEENSITGAKAALINVTGGEDMPLAEIEDAIGMIEEESDENADIIWGNVVKEGMGDEIKVTVIATGFDSHVQSLKPLPRSADTLSNSAVAGYGPGGRTQEEDLDVPTFIRRQAD